MAKGAVTSPRWGEVGSSRTAVRVDPGEGEPQFTGQACPDATPIFRIIFDRAAKRPEVTSFRPLTPFA
jgi:hypothetical protein